MDPATHQARTDPTWIVLTPSIDDAAWRDALRTGIEAAGLVMRDGDREPPSSTDDPARDVWVTADCDVIVSLGGYPTVVLVPRPETAPDAVQRTLGLTTQQSSAHASLLIVRAIAQDRRRTRIVTAQEIVAAQGRPIALTEQLRVIAPPPAPTEGISPDIRMAFEPYANGTVSPGEEIVWSQTLFRYDQRASRDAQQAGELDITGRPRILVYGPYLGMMPGRWRARVRFLVNAPAASKEFRIDWGSPHDFASMPVTPPHAGVFEVELEHDWNTVDFGEVRLWVMEGTFDGILHFLGATVTYVGPAVASAA